MLRSIDQEKCIGCGSCLKACSFDVYRLDTHQERISPCHAACPVFIDMRSYISMLQLGRHEDAANELLAYNPLPRITHLLCKHNCEKVCTRKKIDAPVNIPALEDYLGQWIMENKPTLPQITRAGRVGVVGSGAAGLAAAFFMRRQGYAVDVYEQEPTLGGSLRGEVPADLLKAQLDWLKNCGISFHTNTPVGDNKKLSIDQLREAHTNVIIIATGKQSAAPFASVVDITPSGEISADADTLATRTNDIFAIGAARDAACGSIDGIREAREAAFSANCFCNGWDMLESRPSAKRPVMKMPVEKMFQYTEELPIGNLPPTPRNETDQPYAYETMVLEATRCVTCGAKSHAQYKNDCMTCYFCEIACPVGAITVDPFKERLPRTISFEREGV